LLEDRLDCARHNSTAADPEDREVSIPKILVASVITKEHQAVRLYEELPINFSAHYSSRRPSVIAQAPTAPSGTNNPVGHSLLKMPDYRSLGSRY
jgi:hypothetical protein